MRTHAAELVAPGPDIILAHSSAALAPLLQVTRIVPKPPNDRLGS